MSSGPLPRIERLEPLGRRGLAVRVHLDRGDPIEIALEALEREGIGIGDALDPARRRALLDADADVGVRDAALTLLSYRARTRRELERRLRAKGHADARVGACLDRLQERGLLDDAEVSRAFVRDRLRHRPRGRSALHAELRGKGVDVSTAEDVVAEVFETEGVDDVALAEEVAGGWVARQSAGLLVALASEGRHPERPRAERRLRSYLGRRGFRGDALRAGIARAKALAALDRD